MRYLMAVAGLLVAAAVIAGIWFFLPHGTLPTTSPVAAAETTATPAAPADALSAESGDGSLRVCNETGNKVSVAFGYHADKGWQSEGWWVAEPQKCVTIYQGDLKSRRYYYLFAADDIGGGVWDGTNFMCTRDESFTIFGVEDCLARGYDRTGFFEVDTHNKPSWTLQLIDGSVVNSNGDDANGDAAPLEGDSPDDPGDNAPEGADAGGGDDQGADDGQDGGADGGDAGGAD